MRETSNRRLDKQRGKRVWSATRANRMADEVAHVVEEIPLIPGEVIPEKVARKHRLITREMIAKRYGLTKRGIDRMIFLSEEYIEPFPKPVAKLDNPPGRNGPHRPLYRAEDVLQWIATYRPWYEDNPKRNPIDGVY